MQLVVDANILFSFFRKDSLVREIIINPNLKYNLKLFAPEKILVEIDKHKKEICEKARITKEEFNFPREVLEIFIKIIQNEVWQDKISEANKLLPDHLKDAPYLALALKLDCGIWSYDNALKKQSQVKIFTTKELLEEL
ncbi:MAG: PIN domain-containing protein [Nanoarchaeota archaeon]|nr:PIN domain-containing protein [Nanoarchaeota archaeon]